MGLSLHKKPFRSIDHFLDSIKMYLSDLEAVYLEYSFGPALFTEDLRPGKYALPFAPPWAILSLHKSPFDLFFLKLFSLFFPNFMRFSHILKIEAHLQTFNF